MPSLFRLVCAVTIVACLLPAITHSQGYPTKQVTVVVPFAAGSSTDIIGRQVAASLQQALGKSVIVENRPGAQGLTASQQVSRAPADGYTLLLATNSTHAAAPSLYSTVGYDPVSDFTAVARVANLPLVLVVGETVKAKTVKELADAMRRQPSGYSFGFGGTASQLASYMFRDAIDADITPVPYKSSPPAMNDVIGGRLTMMFLDPSNAKNMVDSGKLRPLAVSSRERMALFPNVPTMAESGYRDFEMIGWFGLVGPKGTPADVVQLLNSTLKLAYASPEIKKKFQDSGIEITHSSPDAFASFVRAEVPRWAKLLKDAGVEKQ